MESFVVFIFIGIFASIITDTLSQIEEFMVTTHHASVMNDYLEMSVKYKEQGAQKPFKKWHTDLKSSVCRKMLNPVSFYVLGETEDFTYGPVPNSVENLLKKVEHTYAFGEMDAINYAVVNVNTKNATLEAVAHLCIVDASYQVAIASAYHNDVYFYLHKTDKMDNFRVFAVAERKAFVHPLINYNPMQLMIAYIDNLKKQIDQREYVHSFCTLSEYQKSRLCSLTYVSFVEQKKAKIDKMNYIRAENGRLCTLKAKILMEFEDEFYYLLTDLISCNINTVSSKLRFYLTPDPHIKDSAYIVRKTKQNPQNPLLIGNFSGVNMHSIDFEKAETIVKDLKMKLAGDRKTWDQSRLVTEGEDLIRGKDYEKNDQNADGPFYQLEMVVMKLTPLLGFED